MDITLYKRIDEVNKNMQNLEKTQNHKLGEIQKLLEKLLNYIELIPKMYPTTAKIPVLETKKSTNKGK